MYTQLLRTFIALALGWFSMGAGGGCVGSRDNEEPRTLDLPLLPGQAEDAAEATDVNGLERDSRFAPLTDTKPPVWPVGAKLDATDVTSDSIQLSWPSAEDDTLVGGYTVYLNGFVEANLASTELEKTLTGLSEAETFVLSVVATDEAGNVSEELVVKAQTKDESAPVWVEEANVLAGHTWDSGVFLSWTPATDNVAVSEYRVMHGEAVVRTIFGATSGDVSTLEPWTDYNLTLVAVDSAGNVSKPGPSITLKTPDTHPPTWKEGSILSVEVLAPDSIELSWKHQAKDAGGLASYTLYQDKVGLDSFPPPPGDNETVATLVKGLKATETYTFRVQANDLAGNTSDTGPTATVKLQDSTAPVWAKGASLLASDISPTQVTLAWQPAEDDVAVATYRVRKDGVEIAAVTSSSVVIEELAPWKTYTFSVSAEDGLGNASEDALVLTLQTPDWTPPNWPKAPLFEALSIEPTTLLLSWSAATDDVQVTQYRVFEEDVQIGVVDGSTTSFAVTELTPWTDYTFRLIAEDIAGNQSETDLVTQLKTSDTEAPTWSKGQFQATDVAPTSLTLSWPEPQDDGVLSSIELFMNGSLLLTEPPETQSVTVTGLSPWVEYTFSVSTKDEANNSSKPLTLTVRTTDESPPTWPQDAGLSVSDLTSTSLLLGWESAIDDVAIDSYSISTDGDDPKNVDGVEKSLEFTGLTPGETYLFAVHASDPAGNISAPLSKTVTLPNAPPYWNNGVLQANNVTGFSIALNWSGASDDGGVTGYRLYRDDELISQQTEIGALVDGLDHSTTYTFRVEAGDELGSWSTDGPSLTLSTIQMEDPGFKRLSKEQFARTLGDLMETHFVELYCNPKLVTWGCKVWPSGGQGLGWMKHLLSGAYGIWSDFRRLYPNDLLAPPTEDSRGGYRRFDQVVHPEHLNSWIFASMMIAQAYVEDDAWSASTGEPSPWGDMGWGDRIVFSHCEEAYQADPLLFESDDAMYAQCVSDFIQDFGLRAFRQPVSPAEHDHLIAIYDAVDSQYSPDDFTAHGAVAYLPTPPSPSFNRASRGLRNVIAVMLNSPKFLYRVELGDENGNLTPYELASRLSYHFWNSMPDPELFAAAADGSLMTEEGYQSQVNRLASSPKALPVIHEFYEDYFRVEKIPDIQVQDAPFADKRYALGAMNQFQNHPLGAGAGYHGTRGIAEASRKELVNLGVWFTRTSPGTYEDMFLSNLNFLECGTGLKNGSCTSGGADLWGQYIYGVDSWDGVSDPEPLPEPERAGLLTRIGMLSHESMAARPIQRGLKIQEVLLCRHIPPPENCDVVKPPVLTGLCQGPEGPTGVACSDDALCGPGEWCMGWDKEVTMTVRDKVEEITETPGTSCAGCHSTFINGLGHALSHFSSEGRYWEKEHMFSTEKNNEGAFVYSMASPENWPTFDTVGSAIVENDMISVDGAHDLADKLVMSGQLEWCWSREYFRFALGRAETDVDSEIVQTLADSLRDGATLAEGFTAIAHLPQFKELKKPIAPQQEEDAP